MWLRWSRRERDAVRCSVAACEGPRESGAAVVVMCPCVRGVLFAAVKVGVVHTGHKSQSETKCRFGCNSGMRSARRVVYV